MHTTYAGGETLTAPYRVICRLICFTCFAFMTSGVPAQSFPPISLPPSEKFTTPMTVEDAVAYALHHNLAVTLAEQNVSIAQDQLSAARAGVRPSLALGVDSTYTPGVTAVQVAGATVSGFTFSSTADAEVSEPLFPFSRLSAPVQAARANADGTREALARTRQAVALQTRQAYYQLLIAQDLRNVGLYAVEVAQGQLKLSQVTFAAGKAAQLDVLQAASTLANAQVALEGARNNVDVSRAALATQMGLPAGTPLAIVSPTTVPLAPPQVTALVDEALAARPDLLQVHYLQRQLQAVLALTRVEELPRADLQAAFNQVLVGSSLLEAAGVSIGMNITFTAFDWGKARADVRAARTQLAAVDTTERQLTLSTTQDVRSAWLLLRNATAQLTSAEKQFEAANEALRIAEVRYRAGRGLYLEEQQAYLSATQALTSFSQATYQAHTAAAQLEFAIGAPLTLTVTPIPALTLTVPTPLQVPATPAP